VVRPVVGTHGREARRRAGTVGTGGPLAFALGLALGLLAVAGWALLTLRVTGYPRPATPPAPERATVVQSPPARRPTPYWRFRDEWLTPRPKRQDVIGTFPDPVQTSVR
jgi:hypothetical protein